MHVLCQSAKFFGRGCLCNFSKLAREEELQGEPLCKGLHLSSDTKPLEGTFFFAGL
jgi:hypothetical protein